jgi:alkaline phosphatase D
MISVWDDHEFTNDSWQKGAQNHSKDEGTFANRKKNALLAYYEWMPIREKGRKDKIWRNFKVGNLINLMMLDTRSYERDKQLDIEKYFEGNSFNKISYLKDINKPRKLLGKEQFNWIRTKVDSSFKWSIFGQQILIGPKYLPTIFKAVDKENFPKFLHKYLSLAGTEIPYNTDQWDGYPKEREKFYKAISNSQSNLILAGDSHNSWLSNLFDKNNKFVGVEIGAPSITSPNFVDTFGDFTGALDKSFIDSNKDLIWTNGRNKGYVELNIFSEYVDVKFNFVSSVKSKNYKNLKPISFKVKHNEAIT